MIDLEATTVPWIDPERRKPLCDVPWLGTSVVLSDGKVNFCCYTSAVAGNVNELTFDEIWNGPVMRNIRSELAQNRFPVECKTDSCPIFRGDTLNYLRVRMDGEESLVLCGRKELAGTELTASRTPERRVSIAIETQNSAGVRAVDLFVAIKRPNGTLYFLPEGDETSFRRVMSFRFPAQCQPAFPRTTNDSSSVSGRWKRKHSLTKATRSGRRSCFRSRTRMCPPTCSGPIASSSELTQLGARSPRQASTWVKGAVTSFMSPLHRPLGRCEPPLDRSKAAGRGRGMRPQFRLVPLSW